MHIVSFNVNGVRAIAGKSFLQDMQSLTPDVLCLQETKATAEQVMETVGGLNGYFVYANEADKKGYSGTAILTKTQPMSIVYDMGIAEHDMEGRVIAAEFEDFYLVTVYTPNSGNDLRRLGYRQTWDASFLTYLKALESKKPVLVCGDLNVAHKSIDLARPKPNYNKSAGHMQQEMDGMDNYIASGLVDTFRAIHGEAVKYSWWSYRGGAREKNVGWRIDYFLASQSLMNKIRSAEIHNDIFGSDHCPVSVTVG